MPKARPMPETGSMPETGPMPEAGPLPEAGPMPKSRTLAKSRTRAKNRTHAKSRTHANQFRSARTRVLIPATLAQLTPAKNNNRESKSKNHRSDKNLVSNKQLVEQ
ncbi:unnamed protein product [Ranitomeya imitator]|uniref:Uncharacterized protein n=1 Tax=Ranitomeya imitator TaxID=111125 RepID=A0ABN9LWZ6_9NEOB|nr:unnamed protein product [Ranitomeya imitator]